MSSLILGSYHIHDAVQICVWFLFFGFAVAAHTAQSEEGKFATVKNTLTYKITSSDIRRQRPYRFDANVALNNPNEASPAETISASTPPSFIKPEKEGSWSINIQRQAPSGSNCSALSSLTCFDSNDEPLTDAKPQQDSFWFVLRKAFHF